VGDDVIFAKGYGVADPKSGRLADEDTIYRAGSISKLFNALAVMQLVEQRKLTLDGPPQQALPGFSVVNPFSEAPALTLRQLLCHRSGLVREAPVGGYLDPSQPSVAQTVESVAGAVLINPPNQRTRYSNVGPTIAGHMIEQVTGQSYEDYQDEHILMPLGMSHSTWRMNDKLRPYLATGRMKVARNGSGFDDEAAPTFELGTIPAGNLYTTVGDLAQFARLILGEGQRDEQTFIKTESLQEMCTPQLTSDDTGFGLGFSVNKYRGHRTVQHMGAVYGFTSSIVVLPQRRLAVIVLSSQDIGIGPVQRISNAALDQLLWLSTGEAPAKQASIKMSPDDLKRLTGDYESTSYWARVFVEDGRLRAEISRQLFDLAPVEPLKFLADGQLAFAAPMNFDAAESGKVESFTAFRQKFRRVNEKEAVQAPKEWKRFVGSYGPSFIPWIVSVRRGQLYAMTENEFDYRLIPVARNVFRMSPGMYDEEAVVFPDDDSAECGSVLFAGMRLPRQASNGGK
jgi:CubicO group peptidase (beta-lactamase class C family)